mgnify:CR=1 FL=1
MKYLLPLAVLALSACTAADGPVANTAAPSVILSEAAVTPAPGEWGTFYPYFTEGSHALDPVLVGVAKINAGDEPHPPHRHVEEEYLMVTKGTGTWYLNGEKQVANEGDILFAHSWDYHGITAADDSPLEFVVFKYAAKGNAPTDPDPTLPEFPK